MQSILNSRLIIGMRRLGMPQARGYATSKKSKAHCDVSSCDKALVARLIRSPWVARGKGSFCTRPKTLYAQKMYKSAGKVRNPLRTLHKYMKQYEALGAGQKRAFEALAARNRAVRVADRKALRGLRASPYALFMKKNYASVAPKFAKIQNPRKRLQAISRAIAAKWKATPRSQRIALRSNAARQRVIAARKLSNLLHQMKKSKKC